MERLRDILTRLMGGKADGIPSSDESVAIEKRVSEVLWLEAPELEVTPDARRLAVLEK